MAGLFSESALETGESLLNARGPLHIREVLCQVLAKYQPMLSAPAAFEQIPATITRPVRVLTISSAESAFSPAFGFVNVNG